MARGKCEICGCVLSSGHIYQKGPFCTPCVEKAVAKINDERAADLKGA